MRGTRRGIVLVCALVFAQGMTAVAQRSTVTVSGYAKNLAIRLASPQSGRIHYLNVSRLRNRAQLDASAHIRMEAWLDTELVVGSYLNSPDYARSKRYERAHPLQMEWKLGSGTGYEVRQRLFRAFLTLHTGRVVFTAGRQRVAWGSGFAWNPTDILNPFNPGAIELGERAGVDAAHLGLQLGPLSRLELVAAYTGTGEPGSFAARAGTNFRLYDVTLLAGRFQRTWVFGGDFAGYARGAGLRGEAAYVRRDVAPDYLRAVLNADYTFRSGLYALVELYFNGRGHARKTRYNFDDLLAGDTFNLARWYLAVSISASISPLLHAGLYQLVNVTDGSLLAGPSLTWSLSQSLDAAVASYFFLGTPDSEYGAQRHVYFLTLQWYY